MTRDQRATSGGNPSERRRGQTADSATLEEQCHPKKVFVGGLSHKSTTQHLREYFEKYGTVSDAVVLRWPDGRSRGFGYVTFMDADLAAAALRDNHVVNGRHVDVKRAVPGTNKLFVGGLPQNSSASELREYFENFGVVSDAVVMMDAVTNRSRGFGFICFLPGNEGATAVAAALDKYEHHRIRGKWIEVKSAAPPHKLPTSKESAAEAAEAAALQVGQPAVQPPDPSVIANAAMAMAHAMAYAAAAHPVAAGHIPCAALAACEPELGTGRILQSGERPVASPQVKVGSPQKVPVPGAPPGLGSKVVAPSSSAASRDLGIPPGLMLPRAPSQATNMKVVTPDKHITSVYNKASLYRGGVPKVGIAPGPPPARSEILSLSSALGLGPDELPTCPPDAKASPKYDMWNDRASLVSSEGLQHSLEQLLRLHTGEASTAARASPDKKER